MEIEGDERLVVVQEVAVRKDPESIVQKDLDELDALIKLVSQNIVAGHQLQAFAIVLIRKGTIPKTSSGKIQRHACRDAFLNRELYVLREWHERKQLEPVLPKPSNAELDGRVPYGLSPWRVVNWDGATLGNWTSELENADVLINLAGRSVVSRYTPANREAIKECRIQTTHLLGQAIGHSLHLPRLWVNASTATIYRHVLDQPMDEQTWEIGGNEPNAPAKWRFSIDVATSWEKTFFDPVTPNTRKIALRRAVVMSPDRGGIFDTLLRLVRFGSRRNLSQRYAICFLDSRCRFLG